MLLLLSMLLLRLLPLTCCCSAAEHVAVVGLGMFLLLLLLGVLLLLLGMLLLRRLRMLLFLFWLVFLSPCWSCCIDMNSNSRSKDKTEVLAIPVADNTLVFTIFPLRQNFAILRRIDQVSVKDTDSPQRNHFVSFLYNTGSKRDSYQLADSTQEP
jgi:uncharacterized SAM-binding protein YcdF (DUF218 family)